jgi:hypothetical protein
MKMRVIQFVSMMMAIQMKLSKLVWPSICLLPKSESIPLVTKNAPVTKEPKLSPLEVEHA